MKLLLFYLLQYVLYQEDQESFLFYLISNISVFEFGSINISSQLNLGPGTHLIFNLLQILLFSLSRNIFNYFYISFSRLINCGISLLLLITVKGVIINTIAIHIKLTYSNSSLYLAFSLSKIVNKVNVINDINNATYKIFLYFFSKSLSSSNYFDLQRSSQILVQKFTV